MKNIFFQVEPPLRARLLPLVMLLVAFLAQTALAGTWFVKPSAEVPLRRGQGKDYRIVAVLQNGTPVELLETEEPWARIRLASGKEGWILKRYLSSEPPLGQQIVALREEKKNLEQECARTRRELQDLTAANAQTEKELTACLIERDRIKADFQTLQQDTADVVRTKKKLTDSLLRVKNLEASLSAAQAENSTLKKNARLKWFLAGGGVLVLGWLLGLITGRSRKRRSSLL